MNPADKIPKPLGPELIETLWSGREARRMGEIIAEFSVVTEGRNDVAMAVSAFGHEKCSSKSSAQAREAQRGL